MRVNGVNLHVVQAGPANGPLVILLHGFPEFWIGWQHQIGALAEAGFCVWVPDQRGYNRSDKPAGVAAYQIDILAADIVELINAAGRERACVAGHDWGAAVTWRLAHQHPDRIAKAAVLNVPHPYVMAQKMRSDPAQLLRSTYILFFQIPGLPERLLAADDYRSAAESMRNSAPPGAFSAEDFARYRDAWSQPGALTAMLNWYRAFVQRPPSWSPSPRIQPPLQIIWGTGDKFLGADLAQPSLDLCDQGRLTLLEGATHWVQHTRPAEVNRLLIEHFTS